MINEILLKYQFLMYILMLFTLFLKKVNLNTIRADYTTITH